MKIFTPIVEHLQLQIRFNLKTRNVEIKTCQETKDLSALTKAADFVKAFILGFQVEDALALIRLDDLFLESFEVTDGEYFLLQHSRSHVCTLLVWVCFFFPPAPLVSLAFKDQESQKRLILCSTGTPWSPL
ncbi:hypothetical protein Nmel_003707 [Mimus melanotis]